MLSGPGFGRETLEIEMMNIGNGNRDEWEFEYTAKTLADGAKAQKAFRDSRVAWWNEQKDVLMTQVRESGVQVTESVAAKNNSLSYQSTQMMGPQVSIKPELQQKLTECHQKIQAHMQSAAEYDGWIQVLEANPENRVKLTQADWLYFFGKV
jgi:hypothetical protein